MGIGAGRWESAVNLDIRLQNPIITRTNRKVAVPVSTNTVRDRKAPTALSMKAIEHG